MDWIEEAAAEIMDRANAGVCITGDFDAIIRRHYEEAAKCKACDGRGTEGHSRNDCQACRGLGEVVPHG